MGEFGVEKAEVGDGRAQRHPCAPRPGPHSISPPGFPAKPRWPVDVWEVQSQDFHAAPPPGPLFPVCLHAPSSHVRSRLRRHHSAAVPGHRVSAACSRRPSCHSWALATFTMLGIRCVCCCLLPLLWRMNPRGLGHCSPRLHPRAWKRFGSQEGLSEGQMSGCSCWAAFPK